MKSINLLQRTSAAIFILFCLAIISVLGFTVVNWRAANTKILAQQEDKPVEQVRKNIKVLNGMPDSQLLSVMHLMRTSLGVRCDYCHIAENGKYWMDDKLICVTPLRIFSKKSKFSVSKSALKNRALVVSTFHFR